jgi:Ion channel
VKGPANVYASRRQPISFVDPRKSVHFWRDRFRDPALSVLLALEICLIFFAAPLAAKGLPKASRSSSNGTGGGRDRPAAFLQTHRVSDAVDAPGRITFHRLQGAAVLYLNAAILFAAAFSLIWGLNPDALAILRAAAGDLGELATMLYFSLATLTTTGYGDVRVDPFARSLANLEAVVERFYLAITVARLVTLEVEDRRR